METADFSLVVERDKGVYAITPLNDVAKEWLPQNVEVISFKGANLVQENDVIKSSTKERYRLIKVIQNVD